MNIEKAIKEFKNYTNNYIELHHKCKLKVDHTLRVMNLCGEIAESLNLSKEDIELAKLCGLLHDIGRFEQWKRYETFVDADSVDHADLGVEVLKNNNYLSKYLQDSTLEQTVLNSIKYHNKYSIPDNLEEKDEMFCKIVRDADKIDILYLYTIRMLGNRKVDESFSDSIYNNLINCHEINRADVKTKGDTIAISLGLVFDINYQKSFEILKEKKYIDKEIDNYIETSDNDKFKEQLKEVRKIINKYIEERITC